MEYAIQVQNLSKTYKLYDNNYQRLKDTLNLKSEKKYYKEFNALSNVSFNIARGEIAGIIGTNGAGKSTLLKIISGVLQPSSGSITVNGKISALLELGAGFNMEYTGIENVRIQGLMNGLSEAEINGRIPQIVEFAEIGDFIYQPVKTYSSGMFARLAFAVSVNVSPDILIIDEALSVGDMYFQEKCYEMMKNMVHSGATILFVSHSLPAVRNFCRKAIWLDKGMIVEEGPASDVCNSYKEFTEKKTQTDAENRQKQSAAATPAEDRKEKNKLIIDSVKLNKQCFYMDEEIILTVKIAYRTESVRFGVGVIIRNVKGEIVTLFNTIRDDMILEEKYDEVKLIIPHNDFTEGEYRVSVNFCDDRIMYPLDTEDDVTSFKVLSVNNRNGVPISEGQFRQRHEWSFGSGVENV